MWRSDEPAGVSTAGRQTRVTAEELARVAVLASRYVGLACDLGVDLAAAEVRAYSRERAYSLRAVAGLRTRKGTDRGERVARCGTLYIAKDKHGAVGLAHWWCRDRGCPGCMHRRQRVEAKLLRTWVRGRRDDLGRTCVMVTLTHVKMPVAWEGCADAAHRLYTGRRAAFNGAGRSGRAFREVVAGGIWYTEVAWSYRGKPSRRGPGSTPSSFRVAFDGWHCHLHGIVELRPGVTIEQARDVIVRAWLDVHPECSASAQDVQLVDDAGIGQVCKYPVKPFELKNIRRQREALEAMVSHRTHDAFGEWKGWRKKAESMTGGEPAGVRLSDTSLGALPRNADARLDVSWWANKTRTTMPAAAVLAQLRSRCKIFGVDATVDPRSSGLPGAGSSRQATQACPAPCLLGARAENRSGTTSDVTLRRRDYPPPRA